MANSKSNIYPIQLQGAELNLNKLDAEIKQYSGFNKNNAPYVGGCLSNVFVKNKQISGGNAKNIWIDKNGDVYKVDVNGFYKNNVKLYNIDGEENPIFWEQEEIKTDDRIVKVFSEKLKVVKSNTNETYNLLIDNEEQTESLLLDFSNSGATAKELEEAVNNDTVCIFLNLNNKFVAVIAGFSGSVGTNIYAKVVDMDTLELISEVTHWSVAPNARPDFSFPAAICYDNTLGQLVFSYCVVNDESQNIKTTLMTFDTIDKDTGALSLFHSIESDISPNEETSNTKLLSNSLSDYHICSYPLNKIVIKNIPDNDKTFSRGSQYCVLETPYYDFNYQGVRFRNKRTLSVNLTGIYGKTNHDTDQELNLISGTLTHSFCSYDYQAVVNDGSLSLCLNVRDYIGLWNYSGFNFSDYESSNLTFKKAKYALAGAIEINDTFRLLFNNNQLSAISGKNVLLTDWNVVDANSITIFRDNRNSSKLNGVYDERIIYKSGSKWYVLKHGAPQLKLFNNQIVINADQAQNSYDIARNKILHFASNYNGLETREKNGVSLYDLTDVSNNIMAAGAVNEYKQEDNSSIILNPVSFNSPSSSLYLAPAVLADSEINIYDNLKDGGAEVQYDFTIFYNRRRGEYDKINPDLVGLPFPSDTNGNVEYNANLFSKIKTVYGNYAFISSGFYSYPLVIGNNNNVIMSYYLASGIENLEEMFIIQGQFYGVIGNNLYSILFDNGVISNIQFIVDVSNLLFVGNSPYEALFFSKTNRCLYSFTGANVLNYKQFVDKISEVKSYLYNPATQTIFLFTDIGVLFYSLFGQFLLEYTDTTDCFLLNNGIVLGNNSENYRYIKYYLDENDEDYIKQNIKLETCFYGMNNQTVTINDCLYFRLFSEEHEEGELKVSATTLSLKGRKTEETTFKIKTSDWDKITHTIYLRYQPKEQRGLGVSFSIDSPFKIASLSVGSQADSILVDKVSKGAINAPRQTSNNEEW